MKIRSGYVSNSSSSSFILYDKRDLDKVFSLFQSFIDNIDLSEYLYDDDKHTFSKESIVATFQAVMSESDRDNMMSDLSLMLHNLIYYFRSYYDAFLRLKKSPCHKCPSRKRFICTDCDCKNTRLMHNLDYYQGELVDMLRFYPKPLPMRLLREAKRQIDDNVASNKHDDVDWDYDEADRYAQHVLKKYPDLVDGAFPSDCGTREELIIRCNLYEFYRNCLKENINCSFLNNS